VCLLTLAPLVLRAQVDEFPSTVVHEMAQIPEPDGPPVTVHGVVVNAATGEGLARALVKIGDKRGALTDSEGRFEIPGVASGIQRVEATKPGFGVPETSGENFGETVHLLRVDKDMGELKLELQPQNSISGHLRLSIGGPGEGFQVVLFRRTVEDGRAVWIRLGNVRISSPSGAFRFTGLTDGTYLVKTLEEFANLSAQEPVCNADAPQDVPGYAATFYGGSAEIAGAAQVVVKGGQNAEANLTLNLIRFHMVQIAMQNVAAKGSLSFEHELTTQSGQGVESLIREEENHTLCAYLPDGVYTLAVYAVDDAAIGADLKPRPEALAAAFHSGTLEFSVEGHADRNLRLTLGSAAVTPVYLHYQPGPPPPAKKEKESEEENSRLDPQPLEIAGAPANSGQGNRTSKIEAFMLDDRTFAMQPSPPGPYWIAARSNKEGVCVGEVTSGGQDLSESPWVAGANYAGAPIDVVLRTDCASLTVEMPASLDAGSAGYGVRYYVYVVPEFGSLQGAATAVVDQYADRSQKLPDLTPGRYRVYAFRTPRAIEFRNPEALKELAGGKEITLEPRSDATVTLEEAAQ